MTVTRQTAVTAWTNMLASSPGPYSDRPKSLDGDIEAFFVLPLTLCKPRNRLDSQKRWQLAKLKAEIWACMAAQYPKRRTEPLPGRPQVLACRFSSKAPDRNSDWAKFPVDRLLPSRFRAGKLIAGLNLIRDDSPEAADVCQFHEYAPAGKGFVVIQVRKGRIAK